MTQTKLKDGIVKKLSQFNITIYDETIKQDFKEPCFFVQFLLNTHRHLNGNRYERLNTVEILYFSDKDDSKEDYDEMSEKLFEALQTIYVEEDYEHPLKPSGEIKMEVEDNVLHASVDYNYHLITKEDITKMKYKEQGVDILDG